MGTPEIRRRLPRRHPSGRLQRRRRHHRTRQAAGRGMQLTESAVKKFAVAKGLPVLQPVKLKTRFFRPQLRALNADLQIVVDFACCRSPFGICRRWVRSTSTDHCFRSIAATAPINWAVINGEHETGVTTFQLQTGHRHGQHFVARPFSDCRNEHRGRCSMTG